MEDTHSPLSSLTLIMIAAPTACHNVTHNYSNTALSLQHSSHMRGVEIHPERYEDMIVCLGLWSVLTHRLIAYLSTFQPVQLPTYLPT